MKTLDEILVAYAEELIAAKQDSKSELHDVVEQATAKAKQQTKDLFKALMVEVNCDPNKFFEKVEEL